MEDRFRFRSYDKRDKKIYEVLRINVFCEGCESNPQDECELMQCTGIKDKNGTLIYEGDIIEVQYHGPQIPLFRNEYTKEPEPERFEIYFNYDLCGWACKNDNYRNRCEIHSLDISKIHINSENKSYEVIGNIYENKDLLLV